MVKYLVSIYSKKLNTLLGRTYESIGYPLRSEEGGVFKIDAPFSLYLVTNFKSNANVSTLI
jgi:hypothetical protein